jgi:hypothetical protein
MSAKSDEKGGESKSSPHFRNKFKIIIDFKVDK